MLHAASAVGMALALLAGALAPNVSAAEDRPDFWAVTGVAGNDVLHLRDVPSAESKSLAGIPSNARGLKNLGCRSNEVPLEQWMRMSQAARSDAKMLWCRVEYRGKQGWVAGRYLKKDAAPAR